MKVVSWNLNNRKKNQKQWDYLLGLNPDVMLLQELHHVPEELADGYSIYTSSTITQNGNHDKRQTAVVYRGDLVEQILFNSKLDGVNQTLYSCPGSFEGVKAKIDDVEINLVSVYNPAWQIDQFVPEGLDLSEIKMRNAKGLWVSDLVRQCLSESGKLQNQNWVFAGDFNICENLDRPKSKGHKQSLEAFASLGMTECVRANYEDVHPTWSQGGKGPATFQLDHMFVTPELENNLVSCIVASENEIFGAKLSDHLPIVAEFAV